MTNSLHQNHVLFRWCYGVALLCLLSVLFFIVFPQYPIEVEDWNYLSQFRPMLPGADYWNPARVLPEVSCRILGFAAACVARTGVNYATAVAGVMAVVSALCVTLVCLAIQQFFVLVLQRQRYAFFASLFFLVCAFYMFRCHNTGNIYLFYVVGMQYIAFYLIPNSINAILALGIIHYATSMPTPPRNNLREKLANLLVLVRRPFLRYLFFTIFHDLLQPDFLHLRFLRALPALYHPAARGIVRERAPVAQVLHTA